MYIVDIKLHSVEYKLQNNLYLYHLEHYVILKGAPMC